MTDKKYVGYPSFVVVALPKSGTKTMNKCFSSLGYKVFDAAQYPAFANEFDDYGRRKTTFADLAKIWEDNKYEVIIEPAGLYWYEMAQHWPETKFIQLTRDPVEWEKSVTNFMKTLFAMPRDASLTHLFFNNPQLSPTAYSRLRKIFNPLTLYTIGYTEAFSQTVHPTQTFEQAEPWIAMVQRKLRMFHADVTLNAPKDRTLFDYKVKDGWPKLREFIGLPEDNSEFFPHENKNSNLDEFVKNLFNETGTDYEATVEKEFAEYLRRNGYELKPIAKD